MKKLLSLSLLLILCSCYKTIIRWPVETPEFISQRITYHRYSNIFQDFLWTCPPLNGIELTFENDTAYIKFCNKSVTFIRENEKLILPSESGKTVVTFNQSDTLHYAEFSSLKLKSSIKQRWVPRTEYVFKTVMEQKMVPVTKTRTVPVQTYTGYGYTTSYRTETYTEYQTKFVYVQKYVPETRWKWEYYTEYSIDIPEIEYSELTVYGIPVTIYRTNYDGTNRYYFQNSSYLQFGDSKGTFYKKDECNTLILDVNSNGDYFDHEDRILFNTWNPYDKNSSYRSIENFIHNKWLPVYNVCKDLNFCLTDYSEESSVEIDYINSDYININQTGNFTLHSIPDNASVFLNGVPYKQFKGKIDRSIELGIYRMVIKRDGYLDKEQYFEISEKSPLLELTFPTMEPGGQLSISNIDDKGWFLTTRNNEGKEEFYTGCKNVYLPLGDYKVTIHLKGFELTKDVSISFEEPVIINYQKEIDKRATK